MQSKMQSKKQQIEITEQIQSKIDAARRCILPLLCDYVASTKSDWNYITPLDFYEKYYERLENHENNRDFILVDLRKQEEYKKMHIKGAINIFWLDLLKDENLKRLPKNKTIFLICYVGHTSSQAMVLLKLLGYKVVSIKFGYGISPVIGVPVAGWTNYKFPVVGCACKA
jgi:rhodanese-related sulfurtransferase